MMYKANEYCDYYKRRSEELHKDCSKGTDVILENLALGIGIGFIIGFILL